jgi:hypothetical protein
MVFGTSLAHGACTPSPLGGGRAGWGDGRYRGAAGVHPHPNPSPSRGRERRKIRGSTNNKNVLLYLDRVMPCTLRSCPSSLIAPTHVRGDLPSTRASPPPCHRLLAVVV